MPNTTREFQAAHHEAGHAVITWICSCSIDTMTIVPNKDAGTEGAVKAGPDGGSELFDIDRSIKETHGKLQITNTDRTDWQDVNKKQLCALNLIEDHSGLPEAECLVSAAGGLAQSRLPDPGDLGDGDDWEKIETQVPDLARRWRKKPEDVKARIRKKTSKLLDDPHVWHAVERLAEALLAKREISGKEAVLVIRDAFGAFE
jgi:hypothetical protein